MICLVVGSESVVHALADDDALEFEDLGDTGNRATDPKAVAKVRQIAIRSSER